jgi:hypothetical protein
MAHINIAETCISLSNLKLDDNTEYKDEECVVKNVVKMTDIDTFYNT